MFLHKICDHESFSANNIVFPPLITALNITYSYPMPMGVRDPPRLSLQCRYVIQTVPPSPRPLADSDSPPPRTRRHRCFRRPQRLAWCTPPYPLPPLVWRGCGDVVVGRRLM